MKYFVLGFYYLFMDFLSVTILKPYNLNIDMPIFFVTDGIEQKIDFYLLFVCFSFWSLQSWPTTATCASQWITAGVSWE